MNSSITSEPICTITLPHTKITILGTAHVSHASANTVRSLIEEGDYDSVAVELCQNRYTAIVDPDAWTRMDIFDAIRSGRVPMITANLVLGAFQQRIADQIGIEPGADMRNAITKADEKNLPLVLIDREIGTTLKRIYRNIGWWQRMKLFSALGASVFSSDKISENDIEKLKRGDILESSFSEFAEQDLNLFNPLIDERDLYMAARLFKETRDNNYRKILAVVGAGHMKGISTYLQNMSAPEEKVAKLNKIPPAARWPKVIPWVLVGIIFLGFFVCFGKSSTLGWALVKDWILYTGTGCVIGTLLAMGHPATVVTAFIAAPITTLHPLLGAGMATGAVEAYFRHPTVKDFTQLRHDASTLGGWWRNRVTRILLVFILSSLGAAVGTYIMLGKIASNAVSCW